MAFVNEYISKEDFEKYGLAEIDQRFIVGGVNARDWTIDRDREIYLRQVTNGKEERHHISGWTFFWHGEMFWFELHILKAGGERGGAGYAHKRIERFKALGIDQMPVHLEAQREQILSDLRGALLAYKDGGVFATCTSYTLDLEIA